MQFLSEIVFIYYRIDIKINKMQGDPLWFGTLI